MASRATRADFEDVAPWIAAQGRRVIAVDIRGRGRSARDPDPARYNPKVYSADVLRLLDAAGISRAVFIGTSMGGIITMAIAVKRLRRHRRRGAERRRARSSR